MILLELNLLTCADQKQSHTSIAVVERHSDGSYVLKALKQRLYVDGLCYLLQEIYGIENKGNDVVKVRLSFLILEKAQGLIRN